MAIHTLKVRRCDMCGGDDAEEWFVQGPDLRRQVVDLCARHSKPIADALKNARPGRVRTARSDPRFVVEQPKPEARPVRKPSIKSEQGELV